MVPKADSGAFLLLFLLVLTVTEPLRPGAQRWGRGRGRGRGGGAGAPGPPPRRALTSRSAVDGAGAMGVRPGAEGAARGTWSRLLGLGAAEPGTGGAPGL